MDENITLYCNDPLKKGCSWSGTADMLVSGTEKADDNDFSHCPYCNGEDFQEVEED